jgi:hypothetical protein
MVQARRRGHPVVACCGRVDEAAIARGPTDIRDDVIAQVKEMFPRPLMCGEVAIGYTPHCIYSALKQLSYAFDGEDVFIAARLPPKKCNSHFRRSISKPSAHPSTPSAKTVRQTK